MILNGIVLDAGKVVISNALTGLATSFASGFLIGDQIGFELDSTDTAPRGNVVYTGPSQDIAVTRIAIDTVRFTCSVPEGAGPFTAGNLVLYMENEDFEAVPFISVVFPYQIVKSPADPQVSASGITLPGSRFAISIELKHSNEKDDVVITLLPPDYSSLPTYATEMDVPPATSSTFKQFVVCFDSRVKTPVMYAIDHNGVRWANPFYQQIRDPGFGQLDGGMDGEGWGGEPDELVFGYWYTTKDENFNDTVLGGADYTNTDSGMRTIGGATYTNTVNHPYGNL